MEDSLSLQYLKLDRDKLLAMGFSYEKGCYQYQCPIMDDKFLLIIKISSDNIIYSDVIEKATNEKYIRYYVVNATGQFVSQMHEEYAKIVDQVKDSCCQHDAFKSEGANLLIKYIQRQYGDELEYLWAKLPDTAIWRNKKNNKWYGLLMTINESKLGLKGNANIEVLDLMVNPDDLPSLIDNIHYFGAYHMNKKHWMTIRLDNIRDIEEIYFLIDNSYNLSIRK